MPHCCGSMRDIMDIMDIYMHYSLIFILIFLIFYTFSCAVLRLGWVINKWGIHLYLIKYYYLWLMMMTRELGPHLRNYIYLNTLIYGCSCVYVCACVFIDCISFNLYLFCCLTVLQASLSLSLSLCGRSLCVSVFVWVCVYLHANTVGQ